MERKNEGYMFSIEGPARGERKELRMSSRESAAEGGDM